jgi:uncharacterized protein YndB with AHSA1/START domain
MTARLRVRTTINASPETTWSALEQIETHVDWMADAQSITFTTLPHTGVGTTFDCRTKIGPLRLVDTMSITEWVPGASMGVEHRGVVRGNGVFTLREFDKQRTGFSWEERLTFPWWLGGVVGERIAGPMLAHIWRGNLARLKHIVEAQSHVPSGGPVDRTDRRS